jgi:hypothetical protein
MRQDCLEVYDRVVAVLIEDRIWPRMKGRTTAGDRRVFADIAD